jgi:hypothetical protein
MLKLVVLEYIYHCVLKHTEVRILLDVVKTHRQHEVASSVMLDFS